MKKHFLPTIIFFFVTSFCNAQNPILWGMTNSGGINNSGTIFNYNVSTGAEIDLHNFGSGTDGSFALYGTNASSSFIQASNGLLYGMTNEGGFIGKGAILSYDIATGVETILYYFGRSGDGAQPHGSLIQANNGLLYGLTYEGGIKGYGTIFSYNISTGVETVLHSFANNDTDGYNPTGSLIQAGNGLLYGMTEYGGNNPDSNYFNITSGIIFSYNISSGKETVIHNFGSGIDGAFPISSLLQASDSLLYGVTSNGGIRVNQASYYGGTIFSYNILTGKETVLHDFGNDTDGYIPLGTLIQANNGFLYGMTEDGGEHGSYGGTIFSYNISTDSVKVLYDFGNGTDGYNPFGSLFQASDGLLYGMTSRGGVNDSGIIFNYNIKTGAETGIYAFGKSTDGAFPCGSLIEVDTPATGINKLSVISHQLSIYPNPTSGQFTIKTTGNQTGYTLEVYNIVGERIYQSVLSNSQIEINLGAQPDGMYFVYLKSDEGVEVGKVMVTK